MALSKTDSQFWRCALLPICAYTLNSGLRFGREIDYNTYAEEYRYWIQGASGISDFEPIWRLLIFIFGNILSLEWQCLVIFMSFFLIFSGCLFLKNYKEVSMYAVPLFAFYVELAENTMRWFVAFSFSLIALYFFLNFKIILKKRIIFLLFFFTLGFLTHYGFIIVEILLLFILFSKRVLFSPKLSIPIFCCCFIFSSPLFLGQYAELLNQIDFLSGKFVMYTYNTEKWLTGEGAEEYTGMNISKVIYSLYVITLGYKVVLNNYKLVIPYNIVLLGTFSAPLLLKLEIGVRLNAVLIAFQFLIFAYIFNYVRLDKIRTHFVVKLLTFLIVFNMGRSQIMDSLEKTDSQLLYVWDRDGRDYLEIGKYY